MNSKLDMDIYTSGSLVKPNNIYTHTQIEEDKKD